MSSQSVVVIVPVSNRAEGLSDIVSMLRGALASLDRPWSILLAVDGDLPEKLEEARGLAESATDIDLIALARNFGEGGALRTGLESVDSDVVLIHPAYLQVTPEVLPRLLAAIDDGADLAFASRRPGHESAFTRLQRWVFNGLMRRAMWVRFNDISCGVRAAKRESLLELAHTDSFHRFLPVQAAVRGFDVRELETDVHPDAPRTRIYAPGVYVRRFLDIVNVFFLARFYHKPLRFFGLIGSSIGGIGFLICLYLTFRKFAFEESIGDRPALLMGVLMIALGFQLLALGLLGELISFTHAAKTRPYRIRDVVRRPAAAPPPRAPESVVQGD